jgi:hypothetical protein
MSKDKDFDGVVAITGSKKSPLVIRLNEYEGTKTLDIRKYFTNDKKELKPTRKGIAVGEKNFNMIKKVLLENENAIQNWFEESIDTSEWVKKNEDLFRKAREALQFEKKDYSTKDEKWKSPAFFDYQPMGGKDQLIFNQDHPFFSCVTKILEDVNKEYESEIKKLIHSIIISYCRAKDLLQDGGNMSPEEFFDNLEFNWGNFLRSYLSE